MFNIQMFQFIYIIFIGNSSIVLGGTDHKILKRNFFIVFGQKPLAR